MNFLEMKSNINPPLYEWYRGVSGSWHHWEKRVFSGEITLHVQGSDEQGGYWGEIILGTDVDRDKRIYTSKREDLYVPFKTPENCAMTIDNVWKEMVNNEEKSIKSM